MNRIKKIIRLSLTIIGCITIIIFLVRTINNIVFKTSITKKYNNAYWIGEWTSSSHSFISGRLVANLQNDLPIDTATNVDVLTYYNIWSLYNLGGLKEFKLNVFISSESSTGGQTNTTEFQDITKTMKFSAKTMSEYGESIEYNGVVDENRSKIVGGYKSKNPDDIGLFELYRR